MDSPHLILLWRVDRKCFLSLHGGLTAAREAHGCACVSFALELHLVHQVTVWAVVHSMCFGPFCHQTPCLG